MFMRSSEIARLIILIEENINPDSIYYGELVKWWDEDKHLWHYGIGLSNTHFFNIGTKCGKELQLLKRHEFIEQRDLDIRVIYGINSHFENDEIIERLKYALRWLNDLPSNSSYQTQLSGQALASLIFKDNKDYIQEKIVPHFSEETEIEFKNYIRNNSPRLQSNILREFLDKGSHAVYIFLSLLVLLIILISPQNAELFIALVMVLMITVSFVTISNFKWSGFQKKKLWDWLQLLIVPLLLAAVAVYLNAVSEARDKDIAKQRQQQEILKDYFFKMQDLVREEASKKIKSRSQENTKFSKEYQSIAQALTLAVLDELDGKRKGKVIIYLAESGFIKKDDTIVSLRNANLEEIELQDINISEVNLHKTSMIGAKLTNVELINSDLEISNFSNATLENVNFIGANLNGLNFYNATLINITVSKETSMLQACYSKKTKVIKKPKEDKQKEKDDRIFLLSQKYFSEQNNFQKIDSPICKPKLKDIQKTKQG